MSSEEEDYMSDAFLAKCVQKDVRPGLHFKREQKRAHNIEVRKGVTDDENKRRFRPYREIEKSRREEGLAKTLDSGNKGFNLLQKMGYKPGSAIGRSGRGRVNPIEIKFKTDRFGLGRESKIMEDAIEMKAKCQEDEVNTALSFKNHLARVNEERNVKADLSASQRVCYDLDLRKGITEPADDSFWPVGVLSETSPLNENKLNTNDPHSENAPLVESDPDSDTVTVPDPENNNIDEGESSDELEERLMEKLAELQKINLENITKYLRKRHFYCIWCGLTFEDEDDLKIMCPGPFRDAH